MLDKVPLHLVLLFIVGLMLAGPVVFMTFMLGGALASLIALGIFAAIGVGVYIVGGRSASESPASGKRTSDA